MFQSWNNTLTILVIKLAHPHLWHKKAVGKKGNVQNKGMYLSLLTQSGTSNTMSGHYESYCGGCRYGSCGSGGLAGVSGLAVSVARAMALDLATTIEAAMEDALLLYTWHQDSPVLNSSCSVPFPWVMITLYHGSLVKPVANLPSNLYIP